MKRIALLGSTGSIGTQTLDLVFHHRDDFEVVSLACGTNIELVAEQALTFRPELISVATEEGAKELKTRLQNAEAARGPYKPDIVYGRAGLAEAALVRADLVVNALVGMIGLEPTLIALKAGRDIALANKETLVTGGTLVTETALLSGSHILPVDSEHSAIFQCIQSQSADVMAPLTPDYTGRETRRIILTASGGPFRGLSKRELARVKAADALKHPNWSMGNKVTIDSATMMNKGLEVIEACHLFNVTPDKIEIVVHRESIVHSAVEFEDGAVVAQLGTPDMKVPIAYALSYPDRMETGVKRLDLFSLGTLHFERPDTETFRCLPLAIEAFRKGGTYPVILNAANEVLVGRFLAGEIRLPDIADGVERAMEKWGRNDRILSLDDVLVVDELVRKEL
jgi:1-deoxy-D-xylulose-5-phosphate reductoisomerase